MHSHHSHSALFCSHAHPGSHPEEMLSRAASLGFKMYGLSEHVPREVEEELYPEEVEEGNTPRSLMEKWKAYLVEARRLQSKYREENQGMQVLVGAETEWISGQTGRFLSSQVFEASSQSTGASVGKGVVDYLVGSVHHAGGIASTSRSEQAPPVALGIPIDFDKATFDQAVDHFRLPQDASEDDEPAHLRLCLSYFEAQYQMIDQFRPEVIGHFDLCRLFMPEVVLLPSSTRDADSTEAEHTTGARTLREDVAKMVDRNIRLAISYGALFEINSASLRKSWYMPYPARDVLDVSEQYRRMLLDVTKTDVEVFPDCPTVENHYPRRTGLPVRRRPRSFPHRHRLRRVSIVPPLSRSHLHLPSRLAFRS